MRKDHAEDVVDHVKWRYALRQIGSSVADIFDGIHQPVHKDRGVFGFFDRATRFSPHDLGGKSRFHIDGIINNLMEHIRMIHKESLFKGEIVLGTRISSFFFFITLKSVCVVISNFKHFRSPVF